MIGSKPWYTSKTVWASLAAIISSMAGLFGLDISGSHEAILTEGLLQLATAVAAFFALYGRLVAEHTLKIKSDA